MLPIQAVRYSTRSSKYVMRHYAKMLSDPENKGERQSHVNFDILGTWDNRIDFSIELKQSIIHGKPIPKISTENTGCASVIGRRNANEDRYCVKQLQPDLLYFGIFDGHGGHFAAEFCSLNMHKYINYWLMRGQTDLECILQKSFLEINNAYGHYITYKHPNATSSGKSTRSPDLATTGSTAVVCLLKNNIELVIASCGDSRALLCRNGEPLKLTIDHCPEQKTEKERILKSGGTIKHNSLGTGLVNGRLAMTRSIGDFDLKPFGVTALPDTRSYKIRHGLDAFLLLTTDGVNFVMSDKEAIDTVNQCRNTRDSAQFLVDQALHYGCEDNASAVVVPFGAWGKFRAIVHNYYSGFGRNLSRSNRF